jgi:peptidoglycan/LPS O-acetylase OafA/YrhL
MTNYIPELDGIRAIAVLLVVTAHMHTHFWDVVSGGLGVYIFFVLSGYLITSLALKEEAETGRLSFTAFYIRRIFRIFPLYYLVLAVYCVLIFGVGMSPEKRPQMSANMPYYLTYFQEVPFFRGTLGTFGHSWSLGIEEKFYLLWPVVAFSIFRSRDKLRWWLACGLALLAVFSGVFVAPYASILAGCALAFAFRNVQVRSAIERAGSTGAYICFAILFLVQLLVMPHWDSNLSKFLYSSVVAFNLAFVLLVRTSANGVLMSRPLVFIGKVSYGIYLVHHLVLNFAEKAMHQRVMLSYLLTVILSIVVAYVLHIAIEKPLIRTGRSLSSKFVFPLLSRRSPASA